MASVSLKLILHSKRYSDGSAPLMLQCIYAPGGGVTALVKRVTLLRVNPQHYEPGHRRVSRKHPNYIGVNATIAQKYSDAEARLLEAQRTGIIDPDKILNGESASVLVTPLRPTLLIHARRYVEDRRLRGMLATSEKYTAHVSQIELFQKGVDIDLADVDEQWVLRFVDWLRQGGRSVHTGKGRPIKSVNTLHRRMKFIGGLFIDARKRGLMQHDPLANLTFRPGKVHRPKLAPDQLNALRNAPDLSERETLARDTFLLQVLAYGARIGDALSWRTEHITHAADGVYLAYESLKTRQMVTVRLSAEGVRLLERYAPDRNQQPFLLPWMRDLKVPEGLPPDKHRAFIMKRIECKTQLCNSALKRVAAKAGLNLNLTTHIARHTFAVMADTLVADKRKISAALGHTKFSTTEVYLSDLRSHDINDAMDVLWE